MPNLACSTHTSAIHNFSLFFGLTPFHPSPKTTLLRSKFLIFHILNLASIAIFSKALSRFRFIKGGHPLCLRHGSQKKRGHGKKRLEPTRMSLLRTFACILRASLLQSLCTKALSQLLDTRLANANKRQLLVPLVHAYYRLL